MKEPRYKTLAWGHGHGLLCCQDCGSLVLREPEATTDRHAEWHERMEARA